MAKKEIICIVCPLGCTLEIEPAKGKDGYQVRGQQCRRGRDYAVDEFTNPTRMVTSTVALRSAPLARLPVKTAQPLPKALIFECMDLIAAVEAAAPVKAGDVLISDLLGTGVDLVATRSVGCSVNPASS